MGGFIQWLADSSSDWRILPCEGGFIGYIPPVVGEIRLLGEVIAGVFFQWLADFARQERSVRVDFSSDWWDLVF